MDNLVIKDIIFKLHTRLPSPILTPIILGRTNEKGWIVKTSDGIKIYSTNEMEEIYTLDLIESDLERLTWSA
jgi:hypothetical protein